jgi:hypothetical protein
MSNGGAHGTLVYCTSLALVMEILESESRRCCCRVLDAKEGIGSAVPRETESSMTMRSKAAPYTDATVLRGDHPNRCGVP